MQPITFFRKPHMLQIHDVKLRPPLVIPLQTRNVDSACPGCCHHHNLLTMPHDESPLCLFQRHRRDPGWTRSEGHAGELHGAAHSCSTAEATAAGHAANIFNAPPASTRECGTGVARQQVGGEAGGVGGRSGRSRCLG